MRAVVKSVSLTSMRPKATLIAITSGKGGVGKTNVSVNLAVALAGLSRRVCLFDADTNQANANVLLGLHPQLTVEQVLDGRHRIEDILLKAPGGFSIVPAASGIVDGERLDATRRQRLHDALATLEAKHEYLLIDTAAGSGRNVLFFLKAAAMIIIVITPEPTSLTNSFALLRVMLRSGIRRPVRVVVNQVTTSQEFASVFNRFRAAVEKYLHFEVEALGHVLADDNVPTAVRLQRPVIYLRHDAPASLCFYELAKRLDRLVRSQRVDADAQGLARAIASAPPSQSGQAFVGGQTRHASPASLETAPLVEILDQATRLLKTHPDAGKNALARAVRTLNDAFIERYRGLPFELDRTLYHFLEINDYPPDSLRALVQTLETLYARHERRPLHDIESNIALIMAESHADEARMAQLIRHAMTAYARQFGHSPPLPLDIVKAAITQGGWDTHALRELKAAIDATSQGRPDPSR